MCKLLTTLAIMFICNQSFSQVINGRGFAKEVNVMGGSALCGATEIQVTSAKEIAIERAEKDAINRCWGNTLDRVTEWEYSEHCFYYDETVDYGVFVSASFDCYIRP